MNRNEFKLKVFYLISASQHWQMYDDNNDNYDNYQMYKEQTDDYEKDIIAEFDKLTARIAQLEAEKPIQCPFPNCGKDLRLSKEVYGYCFECTCGYKSQYRETEKEAMESHDLLSDAKVTGDPWPNAPWIEGEE